DAAGCSAELKTALHLFDDGPHEVGGIDATLAQDIVEAVHAFDAAAHGDDLFGDAEGEVFDLPARVGVHVGDGGREIEVAESDVARLVRGDVGEVLPDEVAGGG